MKPTKATPAPKADPPIIPGFAARRPPSFLCYTCGFRTLDRHEFVTHSAEAHP